MLIVFLPSFYLQDSFALLEWFPVAAIGSLSICPALIWYPLQFEGTWHMRCRHARELWILKHVPCKHRCELWINTYQSSKRLKHFHVSGSWKLYLIWSTLSHVSLALIAHMHTQWALTLDLGGDRWRLWICRPRLRRGASGSQLECLERGQCAANLVQAPYFLLIVRSAKSPNICDWRLGREGGLDQQFPLDSCIPVLSGMNMHGCLKPFVGLKSFIWVVADWRPSRLTPLILHRYKFWQPLSRSLRECNVNMETTAET